MNKKYWLILSLMLVVAIVVAACGGAQPAPDTSAIDAANAAAATAEAKAAEAEVRAAEAEAKIQEATKAVRRLEAAAEPSRTVRALGTFAESCYFKPSLLPSVHISPSPRLLISTMGIY